MVGYFFALACAIAFHELGHKLFFVRNKIKTKSHWIHNSIWDFGLETEIIGDVSDETYLHALWFGILVGVIPIIVSGFIFFPTLLLVVPYGFTCKTDIKKLNEIYKSRGQNFLNLEDDDDLGGDEE